MEQEVIFSRLQTLFTNLGSDTPRTRLNFGKIWAYIKKNRRFLFVKFHNNLETPLFCPYLGRSGVTIPANGTVETTLRSIGPLTQACKWYEQMRQDGNGEDPNISPVTE